MVIQLLSTASLLFAANGTHWDFCASTKACYSLTENVVDTPNGPYNMPTCFKKNPYPATLVVPSGLGFVPVKKNCITDLSYYCLDRESEMELVLVDIDTGVAKATSFPYHYIGKRNCEEAFNDCGDHKKSSPQRFWGFRDRGDCIKYYKKKDRIWPFTSTSLIVTASGIQIFFSFIYMYYCVLATSL